MMRKGHILVILAALFVLGSCSYSRHPDSLLYDPNNTGYEFAPAMYHSFPYEPLTQVTNKDATSWHYNSMPHNDYNGVFNSNSITPVAGTIARGKMDYYFAYEDSDEGRAAAAAELSNPIELDDYNLLEGKRLYNLYCDHCHGTTGDGNGSLVEAGKIPTPGEYYGKLADLTAGSIYHTITLGKGIMGSHASQLSPEQRWLITHWVQVMQQSADAHTTTSMDEYHHLMEAGVEDESEAEEVQEVDDEDDVEVSEETSTEDAAEVHEAETH